MRAAVSGNRWSDDFNFQPIVGSLTILKFVHPAQHIRRHVGPGLWICCPLSALTRRTECRELAPRAVIETFAAE